MAKISLNQKLNRVEFGAFEIDNSIVFNFFNGLSESEREDKLFRALYIGVLALAEDRLSAFFAKTQNELGTELESLKIIFEMKKELFYKSAIKGILAEEDIAEFLKQFIESKKLEDRIYLTGNIAGKLPKNKTGDIICEVLSDKARKITIECKFDKSIKLGDIESKDIFTKKAETAYSQLIEAGANRDSEFNIIVFDSSIVDAGILKKYDSVGFIPSVGFICIIDSQKGDYKNLAIAYLMARDLTLNLIPKEVDFSILELIVKRLIKDANDLITLKDLVKTNILNNIEILKRIEKNIMLTEFNQKYLITFLKEGTLSKKDLLAFYSGDDIRDRYKLVSKEIENEYGIE